eukprot:snap_masked-scaffold_79-processed-gene-0.10-mRNA-1 protein AED:0.43 eAED:0.45 QI:0/0/0/1/1/1/2/0/554
MDKEEADEYITQWFMKLDIESYHSEVLESLETAPKLLEEIDSKDSGEINLDQCILNTKLNLKNQRVIRVDIERTCKDIGKVFLQDNIPEVLQKLLTFYCKLNSCHYKQGLNDLLAPFVYLILHSSLHDENQYIDKEFLALQSILRTFELIIQYHDPIVENYLDTNEVSPELYAGSWILTLFSRTCGLRTLNRIWSKFMDAYCEYEKEYYVNICIFISLVVVLKNRDSILESSGVDLPLVMNQMLSKQRINDFGFGSVFRLDGLEDKEIEELFDESRMLFEFTPRFLLRKLIDEVFFVENVKMETLLKLDEYSAIVSSPEDVKEFIEKVKQRVLFVDSRAREEFLEDSIQGSIHFDSTATMFSSSFQMLVDKIKTVEKEFGRLARVFVFGNNVVKIVSALIVENIHYVSYLCSGYEEIKLALKNEQQTIREAVVEETEYEWINLNASENDHFKNMIFFVAEEIVSHDMKTRRCVLGISDSVVFHLLRHPKEFKLARVVTEFGIKEIVKITSRKSRKDVLIFHMLDGENVKKYGFVVKRANECLEVLKKRYECCSD